jgi:hypothetical protein
MDILSLLFDPRTFNLFQLAAMVIFCLAVGWFVAVAYHYDRVDEVICQLHATDDTRPAPRSLTPLLDALADLFAEHRVLLWRHATGKGEKPRSLHDLHSTVAYVRAYNVLRAYGRAPRTADVASGEAQTAQAPARERRRVS